MRSDCGVNSNKNLLTFIAPQHSTFINFGTISFIMLYYLEILCWEYKMSDSVPITEETSNFCIFFYYKQRPCRFLATSFLYGFHAIKILDYKKIPESLLSYAFYFKS